MADFLFTFGAGITMFRKVCIRCVILQFLILILVIGHSIILILCSRSPGDAHAGSSTASTHLSHGRSPHASRPNAPPEDAVPGTVGDTVDRECY